MGSEIGSFFKAKITKFVKSSEMFKSIRENVDVRRYEKLRELATSYFPQYMEEIRGISEGSGVDFQDLVILNFKYEYPLTSCSTIVFKIGNRIILGHNEDNDKENEENSFLIIARPRHGTPFISYCYPGMIPGNAFSFNSNGIIMTGNAMPTPDLRVGVPRHLIDRFVIEAPTIDDAVERALFSRRASGFSYNLASLREKRVINLETTSQKHYLTEVNGRFFHTNHYVSSGLNNVKQRIGKSSLQRYRKGIETINKIDEVSEQSVIETLSSAENKPYSIYASGGRGSSWTLYTAIFNISDTILLKIYARKERKCDPLIFTTKIIE